MANTVDMKTFDELEALVLLLEESDIAHFEYKAKLLLIDRLIRRAKRRNIAELAPDKQILWIASLRELAHNRALLKTQKETESYNRTYVADRVVTLLKEVGLWRTPSLPLSSKKRRL